MKCSHNLKLSKLFLENEGLQKLLNAGQLPKKIIFTVNCICMCHALYLYCNSLRVVSVSWNKGKQNSWKDWVEISGATWQQQKQCKEYFIISSTANDTALFHSMFLISKCTSEMCLHSNSFDERNQLHYPGNAKLNRRPLKRSETL